MDDLTFMELTSVLGNLGEFIGSVAVVATLIYLAIQVRQNSRQMQDNVNSLQVSAYQDLMSRISEMNRMAIENPDWAAVTRKAVANPEDLTEIEFGQYTTYVILLLRHADMAYMQYERGLLDGERYLSSLGPFLGSMRASAVARTIARRFLSGEHSAFTPEFRVEAERLISECANFPYASPHGLREETLASVK